MASKNKEVKLPNKTTMNLYVVENDNAKQLPYFLVGLILLVFLLSYLPNF